MSPRTRTRTSDIARQDARFLGRDAPANKLEIVHADGSRVRDAQGRTYIDFQMGWCVGNLGWNHPRITARLAAFRGPSYIPPSALYRPWVEIARLLAELTPGRLQRSYRATGGTEAVEIAMAIARKYTGREKVLAIAGDYHGNSSAVKAMQKTIPVPLDGRALARLERLLAKRDVAALVMEPIVCNLGVEIPASTFMTGAVELCAKYGTLLVADEVATGFGRTGRLFACEHYDLEPDILCVAKAFTSGHAPMGATLTTVEIADAVAGDLEMYSTFGWHPLACEAALATLEIWRDEGDALLENVAARSTQFMTRLATIVPDEAELRVKGLAIGIAMDDAESVAERCQQRGLLVAGEEEYLTLFPALTIDEATADEGLDILASAFQARR